MQTIRVHTTQNGYIHYPLASVGDIILALIRLDGTPPPVGGYILRWLTTEKLKSLLGIQSDLPPVKFLYTIVKDYNHLTSQYSG